MLTSTQLPQTKNLVAIFESPFSFVFYSQSFSQACLLHFQYKPSVYQHSHPTIFIGWDSSNSNPDFTLPFHSSNLHTIARIFFKGRNSCHFIYLFKCLQWVPTVLRIQAQLHHMAQSPAWSLPFINSQLVLNHLFLAHYADNHSLPLCVLANGRLLSQSRSQEGQPCKALNCIGWG